MRNSELSVYAQAEPKDVPRRTLTVKDGKEKKSII